MEIMNHSRKYRRIGVIVSFLALFMIVSIFEYYVSIHKWDSFFIIVESSLITIFTVSIILTYFKTGLWSFTHKSLEKLDEREISLMSKSLRKSYAIFTVSVLFLIMLNSLAGFSVHMVTVAALILFSHIVPASVIAWSEKED